MKVHLYRSPEFSKVTYDNTINLLKSFNGQIDWISYATPESSVVDELPRVTWDELFERCTSFRESKKINKKEIVILLTDKPNKWNWFGGVDDTFTNFFIHTAEWESYFGSKTNKSYPIAYEVVAWVLRYFMFDSIEEIVKYIHKETLGCVMDYCENKKEIIIKMRTGDLCDQCIQRLIDRDVNYNIIQQLLETLDGIRKSLLFKTRSAVLKKPSRLEIKGKAHMIYFKDYGNIKLPLNPIEKTIYLTYLKSENLKTGIHINDLFLHKAFLSDKYKLLKGNLNDKQVELKIDKIIDPEENEINIQLSRINKKIKNTIGADLYPYYAILGERGLEKRIALDEELIIYKNI
ncbi:MAG: hypothetical protein ACOVNZ_05275 [Crocinitomicaceae bacterium]